jgi:hypothetical protein
MRAREFTINVPITIKINGDGDPEIETGPKPVENDSDEVQQNPVMVSPLQQELELKKAELGKETPVIDKLTADQSIGEEPPQQDYTLARIKSLISR